MSLSPITYAMSKKYTEETASEFGGLKGASCQIQSIVKQNGHNTVTFLWVNSEGVERTSQMIVDDGTNIYTWTSGNTYAVGDIAIYDGSFYQCVIANSDITFTDDKWTTIGGADGNFDIVENSTLLPNIYTSTDRKMFYSIADRDFWLWNGNSWDRQSTLSQYTEMPTASSAYQSRVVQYIGQTTESYTFGYFYTAVLDNAVYKWSAISGQGTVVVDSELSLESENPVQNKVITQALIDKTSWRTNGEVLIYGSQLATNFHI